MKPTILITGGSGKFGRKFIDYFLKKNMLVVFTTSHKDSLKETLLHFDNTLLLGFVSDFMASDFSQKILSELENRALFPHYLINNARSLKSLGVEENGVTSRENFTAEYTIDVIAPYELTMALASQKDSQLRSVVNISSQYGVVAANPHLYDDPLQQSPIHYGVAKAALNHLTRELAIRLADQQIQVNTVAFGGVEGRVDNAFKERYAKLNPMKRMLREDELTGPIDFLLSDASSGMTGQIVQVDNGWSLW